MDKSTARIAAITAAKTGKLEAGTIRIRLVMGRNSGAEGTLTGDYRQVRGGHERLGCDLDGIGFRYISQFEVI